MLRKLKKIVTWPSMQTTEEMLNNSMYRFGVPEAWQFVGLFSSGPLSSLPIPDPIDVVAVILHFPFNEAYEEHRQFEQKYLEAAPKEYPKDLAFLPQTTRHGCVVDALIHIFANSKRITLKRGIMKDFIGRVKEYSPEERIMIARSDEPSSTDRPPRRNQNFVSFLNFDGVLYELDGFKTVPISHGRTTTETFLHDVIQVCSKLSNHVPRNGGYNMLVLGPRQKSE